MLGHPAIVSLATSQAFVDSAKRLTPRHLLQSFVRGGRGSVATLMQVWGEEKERKRIWQAIRAAYDYEKGRHRSENQTRKEMEAGTQQSGMQNSAGDRFPLLQELSRSRATVRQQALKDQWRKLQSPLSGKATRHAFLPWKCQFPPNIVFRNKKQFLPHLVRRTLSNVV